VNTTEIQHAPHPTPKEKNLIASLPARMFFAYLCSLPGAGTIVESSSNILRLLAAGFMNPAICLQMMTIVLQPLFSFKHFQFSR
jgi:hypothetical protein